MAKVARTTPDVPGLELRPHYLDFAGQRKILAVVDALPWRDDLRRRVQHYGYRYDYRARAVGRRDYLGPLPGWAEELAGQLAADTPVDRLPDQLIVNEYLAGQGISAHVDCVPCFGDVVLSISLGSACVMRFAELTTDVSVQVLVEPGALMVMTGEARYAWRHSIAARRSDVVDGRRIERDRRVSLTFRTVLGANSTRLTDGLGDRASPRGPQDRSTTPRRLQRQS
jgi:alkylated DNA repair dioxygenase AlkB